MSATNGTAADAAAAPEAKKVASANFSEPLFGKFSDRRKPATAEENAAIVEKWGTVVDPSNPSRVVPAKRANRAMQVHQKWKEEQIKQGKMDPVTGERLIDGKPIPPSALGAALYAMVKWIVVALLTTAAAGQFVAGDPIWGYRGKYLQWNHYFPPHQKVFTPAELKLYNGRDPDKPILLAIMGDVYDVSANKRTYGPGGSYNFFTGADGSRAYVTGCFKYHITHDLRGFDDEQMASLQGWHDFFEKSDKYPKVGTVDLPPIDPDSELPTNKC